MKKLTCGWTEFNLGLQNARVAETMLGLRYCERDFWKVYAYDNDGPYYLAVNERTKPNEGVEMWELICGLAMVKIEMVQ